MKQAITNLINALADWIRPTPPCPHEWRQWQDVTVEGDHGAFFRVFHLKCLKCGQLEKVKSH